jgi:uncharacterized protein YodC (DUF2158 family)
MTVQGTREEWVRMGKFKEGNVVVMAQRIKITKIYKDGKCHCEWTDSKGEHGAANFSEASLKKLRTVRRVRRPIGEMLGKSNQGRQDRIV